MHMEGYYTYQALATPDEEGGFDVEVPALPGCYTHGDTYAEAAEMAADAVRTYVASLLLHGEAVPRPSFAEPPAGAESMVVCVQADAGHIVRGEVVSAAEASRRLGVTPGRVTHMIDSGVLEGYRRGRRTFVTVKSVERRLEEGARPGRPRRDVARA